MRTTTRTVVGVFEDYASAQAVARELEADGFDHSEIEVMQGGADSAGRSTDYTATSGRSPAETSGGGLGGFLHRVFGGDEHGHHHRTYQEALQHGHSVVCVDTDELREDRAAEIMDRHGAVDIDQGTGSLSESSRSGSAALEHETSSSRDTANLRNTDLRAGDTDRTVPVVKEELHVGKRTVQRGGVRIFNRVVNEPVEEQVTLREERVRIDRRPADRPATEADMRLQDEVIEVREMAEEPVVGKRARVVEEVVVGKETRQRTEKIRDTVRRTDVNVEQLGASERGNFVDDDEFRHHFESSYANMPGATYETYAPAYQYGYRMASDDRYRGRRWDEVESTFRSDYERQYPNSKWEQMKLAVRHGWEKMTGKR